MMPLHPLGILIVDDDERDFRSTRELFERGGATSFVFEWAPNYEAGLAAVVAGTSDVCFVDYDLEGRSGLDLVREAHHRGAQTPMILLNGHDSRIFDEEIQLTGADDCISKWQLTPALLERSVRYAIESSRMRAYARECFRVLAENVNVGTADNVRALREVRRLAAALSRGWTVEVYHPRPRRADPGSMNRVVERLRRAPRTTSP